MPPYRFPRPCLKCQKLHRDKGDYCAECRGAIERAREADPKRRAHKKNLYNYAYRQKAKAIKLTATHCWICREPFQIREEITADHLIPGNPDSPLAAAHKRCNSSRGKSEHLFE